MQIVALGGLGEFGMNCTVIRHGRDLLVIDAGLMFPEEQVYGVDIVVPDFSHLEEEKDHVRAIVLTHGHEDHVGALPYLFERVRAPIYGSDFTLGLAARKLREHGLPHDRHLKRVAAGDAITAGPFRVEFIQITHSIPGSLALAIETPSGTLIHTGDFKMDQTPVDDRRFDFQTFSYYGDQGVLALLSDSTNAEVPGFTDSERRVGEALDGLFRRASGRIIVSTFSSNVHRIRHGPPGRAVVVAAGSQGEPMSALSRIALGDHRDVSLEAGDLVILSARPIPGNEKAINRVVNHIFQRGAEVILGGRPPYHVSGHASVEELKIMLTLTRPRYFVPIHGELRQLLSHARLAERTGLPRDRILLAASGDVMEIGPQGARIAGKVRAGRVFIDGSLEEVEEIVVRDRRHISEGGIVLAVEAIDKQTGALDGDPEIVSRGFVHEEVRGDMLREASGVVRRAVEAATREERADRGVVKALIQRDLKRHFRKSLDRRPMIIPAIIET